MFSSIAIFHFLPFLSHFNMRIINYPPELKIPQKYGRFMIVTRGEDHLSNNYNNLWFDEKRDSPASISNPSRAL